MKIKYIVLLLLILLSLPGCAANSTNIAEGLLQQTESTDMEQLNADIQAIYNSDAAKTIITEKPIMLLTLISDADIKSATLSDPIPVFLSTENYKK